MFLRFPLLCRSRRAGIWYEGNISRYLTSGDMISQRISELLVKFGEESTLRDLI